MTLLTPEYDDSLFANPGQGIQTVQRAARPDDLIPSGSAYIKYYAAELVQADGSYDFSKPLADLAAVKAAGQTMVTRIALVDPAENPNGFDMPSAWQSRMNVIVFTSADTSPPHSRQIKTPDFKDTRAVEAVSNLYRAFAKAIGSDPTLDGIDSYCWGLWGEGHYSGTKVVSGGTVGAAVPLPPIAVRRQFIDLLNEIFPTAHKYPCLDDTDACAYSVSKGSAWAQDGVGNPTHMTTLIPQWIAKAKAQLAWMRAPIRQEIYGRLDSSWPAKFEELLRYCPSLVNLKTVNPSPELLPAVQEFARKVGPRVWISHFSVQPAIHEGDLIFANINIENQGSTNALGLLVVQISDQLKLVEVNIAPWQSQFSKILFAAPAAESVLKVSAEYRVDKRLHRLANIGATHNGLDLGTLEVLPALPTEADEIKAKYKEFINAMS